MLKHLQTFKIRVHKFLGGKTVMNPATRGRGGDRSHERPPTAASDEAAEVAFLGSMGMVDWKPRFHQAD